MNKFQKLGLGKNEKHLNFKHMDFQKGKSQKFRNSSHSISFSNFASSFFAKSNPAMHAPTRSRTLDPWIVKLIFVHKNNLVHVVKL